MKRREFITLVGGAAAKCPLAARAQQANRVRRVGALIGGGESTLQMQARYSAFREGLEARGWFENRNLRIGVRFASASDQLRAAAELVALAPEVILSAPVGLRPLQQVTSTIPVVFVLLLDPVGTGFVASLARPAGNMTGFAVFDPMNSTWPLPSLTMKQASFLSSMVQGGGKRRAWAIGRESSETIPLTDREATTDISETSRP